MIHVEGESEQYLQLLDHHPKGVCDASKRATCLVCKSSAYGYKGNAPVPAAAAGEVGSAVP